MALLMQDGQVTPFPFVSEVAARMWPWGLDVRSVAFHPDGRTEVRLDEGVLVGYADLDPILDKFDPDGALSRLMVVDEFDDLPEVDVEGLDPVSATRDPRVLWNFHRKGPGNGWKVHRNTQYHTLPSAGSKWDRAS